MNSTFLPDEDEAYRLHVSSVDVAIRLYIYPIIFVVGMVGNTLMFLLMSQPEFRLTSVSVYMRGLAVTDSLYLIGRVLQAFIFTLIPGALSLDTAHLRPLCMEYSLSLTFSQAGSLLLLMCMTFERAFAVVCPYKTLTTSPRKRAFVMTVIVLILAMIWTLPFVLTREYMPQLKEIGWACPFSWPDKGVSIVIQTVESICGYTSCTLLVIANCIMLKAVLAGRVKRRENDEETELGNRKNDDLHFLYMLIIVSFTYVIPYLLPRLKNVYYLHHPALTKREKAVSSLLSHLSVMIENCNFACNFYFYALPVRRFREVLFKMLKRQSRLDGGAMEDANADSNGDSSHSDHERIEL